jgi:uncharacterized protein YndB with AHSA1/START domain
MQTKTSIKIEAIINSPIEKVWTLWTLPEHITQWNQADPSWHCPSASNDLKVGGKFSSRMEAKDGSFGFDFWGIYDQVVPNKLIAYTMGDGRKAEVTFTSSENKTQVITIFEAETENPVELQKGGWQSILNSFKKYAEDHKIF